VDDTVLVLLIFSDAGWIVIFTRTNRGNAV
jgi:hypothetical protein